MNWYYAKNNERLGPYTEDQLNELVARGEIASDTQVWREGMETWLPYSEARALVPQLPENQAYCAECGKVHDKSTMIKHGGVWTCSACKPIFLQKLNEGVAISQTMRYAGFWIRFCAKLIDGLLLGVVLVVPLMVIMFSMGVMNNPTEEQTKAFTVVQLIWQVAYYAVAAAYSIYFTGKSGATPGKMACGIKVVDASGAKISYGRATGRFFAEFLSAIICYIGYIMVAFDAEKRALHDRICDTRVIYK